MEEGDEMIDVTHYVEIPNETGKFWLGIGKIADTNNIYIERFYKLMFTDNENLSQDKMEKYTIVSKTFTDGQYYLEDNDSTCIGEKYINMFRDQYKNFPIVKKDLIPVVEGFECITGEKRTRTKSIEL